jgi:hypothetical protein
MGSVLKAAAATAVIVGVCTGIAFAATAMIGPSGARAGGSGPGCQDFYVCFWPSPGFFGDKTKYQAGDCPTGSCTTIPPAGANSAKNRFSNRRVRVYNTAVIQISCLDPGENRPNLGPPDGPAIYWNPGPPGSICP